MSQNINFNLNSSLAKEHALLPKPIGRESQPAQLAQNTATKEQVRGSGLQWEKVDGKNGQEGDIHIVFNDTLEFSSSTVLTPRAVKAPNQLADIRENLQNKFMQVLEQTYANCFHHNRLVAKVAEWTVGTILNRLSLLGVSPKELEKMRKRIRKRLIEQNASALFQVVYDETMLEVVG